jgi:hypothetical protein
MISRFLAVHGYSARSIRGGAFQTGHRILAMPAGRRQGAIVSKRRLLRDACLPPVWRRRDAASMFTVRNSHRARRRGWIVTSTSAAELGLALAGAIR